LARRETISDSYKIGGIPIAGNTIKGIEYEISMLTCEQVEKLCNICGCGVDKIVDVVARTKGIHKKE